MKRQIRRLVFETNSSSTHVFTIVTNTQFKDWKDNQLMYDLYGNKLIPYDKSLASNTEDEYGKEYFTYKQFQNAFDWAETFEDKFVTPSGDLMTIFGYYGYNG